MKKLLVFWTMVFFVSCNKNCDDCGTYASTSYAIFNRLEVDVNLVFFRQGQNTEIKVENNKKVVLHQLSVVSQEGVLDVEPIVYDSLQINSEKYFKVDCSSPKNMLCIENYELTQTEDESGNTFKEYVLEIKQ